MGKFGLLFVLLFLLQMFAIFVVIQLTGRTLDAACPEATELCKGYKE